MFNYDATILCEKPKVCFKIAKALSKSTKKVVFEKKRKIEVYRYEMNVNGERIAVVPAVGHVFSLRETNKSFDYPVFNIKWDFIYKVDKNAKHVEPYIKQLQAVLNKSKKVFVACDYDVEGQTIAYNILRFICGLTDEQIAKIPRMKFSSLTDTELKASFNNPIQFEVNMALAGETRAIMDWWWGINASRALMNALKRKNSVFRVLSIGRVQGPTLNLIYDREREIESFVPKKFWSVKIIFGVNGLEIETIYFENRIWVKDKALEIVGSCEGKKGIVKNVKERDSILSPPVPFNLSDLLVEAHSKLNFNPMYTQQLAQNLYENGLISYPRTNSQKLPASMDYREILERISKQEEFKSLALKLLAKDKLIPVEGKKTDPAHPCIYPTGEKPVNLSVQEKKLYNLIVHRFLALFAGNAVVKHKIITVEVKGQLFKASGVQIKKLGWIEFYPYYKQKEKMLPELRPGQELENIETKLLEGETNPPPRYSPAKLIKELEKNNLGTKATRAPIIDKLYQRKYIKGKKSIVIEDLGKAVIEVLRKYCPEIVSVELTRYFEDKLERIISEGEKLKISVLKDAKKKIQDIMMKLKEKEDEIGEFLYNALINQLKNSKIIGPCIKCEDGYLKLIVSKKTGKRFIGCSNWPDKCSFSIPLPQKGRIEVLETKCNKCGLKKIELKLGKSRRPLVFCPKCNYERYFLKTVATAAVEDGQSIKSA